MHIWPLGFDRRLADADTLAIARLWPDKYWDHGCQDEFGASIHGREPYSFLAGLGDWLLPSSPSYSLIPWMTMMSFGASTLPTKQA